MRSILSLAHALGGVTDLDNALRAVDAAVQDADGDARIALFEYDARSTLLTHVRLVGPQGVQRTPCDVALDHLPARTADAIRTGGGFVDLGDDAPAFSRLIGIGDLAPGGGRLLLRPLRFEGQLSGVLALVEGRRAFEVRVADLAEPLAAVFELAHARVLERETRLEAVRTLEETTRRVHADYVTRLATLERQVEQRDVDAAAQLARERDEARFAEEARRASQRYKALEQQVSSAVAQLEQAHLELHRRSEALRQRTRTLFLIERVLGLATAATEPQRLAEGLLGLAGDDMQAMRCSLLLKDPTSPDHLFLAAARGLAPHIKLGSRVRIGEGIAGEVASSRQPLLVVDPVDAISQPLLGDEYLTTGSFICFPLELRGEVIGVVNLTNRAQRGLFVEEDMERVRLLALVIALAAGEAQLATRLRTGMHGQ